MPGDDDFDITKYVLRLSKKIAQLTKDYVGLPFSTTSQLPFAIDTRPQERSTFFSSSKKWQKGDALVGFHASQTGQKSMILNLPDGSTMLDMCYPGWEVAVLDQPALELFFRRRYLFGDYYGHFLNGTTRPVPATRNTASASPHSKQDLDAMLARQEEVFRKRRASLQEAAERQQKRGVSFDAQPEQFRASSQDFTRHETSFSSSTSYSADEKSQPETTAGKTLVTATVVTRSVRDANTGLSENRLVIQKKYNNGEIETIERRSKNPISGKVDADLDQLLSSDIFKVFPDVPRTASGDESESTNGVSSDKDSHY